MTDIQFSQSRYSIIFDALNIGLKLNYKNNWDIFFIDSYLYQAYEEPATSTMPSKVKVHKCGATVNELMSWINGMSVDNVKRVYGDTKLMQLQNRLLAGN